MASGNSCLLGSINLDQFVENPFTKAAFFNLNRLKRVTDTAVRALNIVLDEGLPKHPLQEQKDAVHDWRQIGLGTTSLATALIRLGLTYGSKESIEMVDKIYHTIAEQAIRTSLDLAKKHGMYPKCKPELIVQSEFFKQFDWTQQEIKEVLKYGLRNCQILTCAPNGSIGSMIGTGSTGIESVFALSYYRTTKTLENKAKTFKIDVPVVAEYKQVTGNEDIPDYFVSVYNINPLDRIKVQATAQHWIDGAISSTCNLPETATIEDVKNIYIEAWKLGCKGCTIFRDNCKRVAILSNTLQKEEPKELQRGQIIKAGDNCIGLKRTLMTGCGTLHMSAFFDPVTGDLLETYLSKGSQGGCNNFMIGLSRMMSLAARGGIKIESILDQLKSCGTCPSYAVRKATKGDVSLGSCCPTAVGNALKDMHKEVLQRIKCCNQEEIKVETQVEVADKDKCPECGAKLEHTCGCNSCPSCGYSKCS